MKRFLLSFACLLLAIGSWGSDYDFEVDGIAYRICSSSPSEVEVAEQRYSQCIGSAIMWNNGEVVIPSTIKHDGKTYSVTSIGDKAFDSCYEITSIIIPNSVTSIGNYAFSSCSQLTSITIPNSVTSIGNYAFSSCSQLTSITIPNSVTSIGDYAFSSCYQLTSITIPNSVISIGDYAFNFCKKLTSITIPNSVISIGDYAFSYCNKLTSITIPNSVISIGNHAFSNCDNLTSITIPNSVTRLGYLGNFDHPTEFVFEEESPYKIEDGILFGKNGTEIIQYFDKKLAEPYTIPNSVTSIGDYAFNNCNLTSIIIPNSVTSIGNGAFGRCVNLTSITIPNSVTSIGDNAFIACGKLTSVTIPNSVTSIGSRAFDNCNESLSITIPNSVIKLGYLGQNVYQENVIFQDGNSAYKIVDGALLSKDGTEIIQYLGRRTIQEHELGSCNYTLPSTVKRIHNQAFSGRYLTSLTVPNSITNIGDSTFINSQIVSITLPETITSIGDYAFYGCSQLTSIKIPESVTSIGDEAFTLCHKLASITIPNSVTSIGNGAFNYCENLASITLPETITSIGDATFKTCNKLTSITIPESVTSIGDEAFLHCYNLTSITIPESVKRIGGNAFYGCSALTSITIPKGITHIRHSTFSSCYGLTEIIIPETVTSIGDYAFSNCTSLTSMKFSDSVTSIGRDIFRGCTGLTDVYIPNTVKRMKVHFSGLKSLKKVYLPENAEIGDRAFTYTEGYTYDRLYFIPLEELSIGSFAGNLGKYFAYSYYIPGKYTVYLGNPANCKQNGKDYSLPNNMKLIIRNQKNFDDYALQDTPNMSIELGVPVESIGTCAFQNAGLSKLTFADDVKELPTKKDLGKLPNLTEFSAKGLESIESGIFEGSPKLQKLELPFPGPGTASSVGNFGDLFGTTSGDGLRAVTQFFENGTNKTYYIPSSLTELVLSEGCEMIPYGGLYNCNMLEKVTLPTSLYMVGEKAFYGCAKISDIYCKGADPAVAYDSSFEGIRVSSCKLHIPYNTAELYKRSTGWKNFYYFEEEAPLRISVTKTIENAGVIYGINEYRPGQTAELKAVANSGYTFKGWMENGLQITDASVYSFVVSDSRALTAWFVPVLDDNTVEISSAPDGAVFGYTPVEGAASYCLDVYTDEDMSVSAGSTVETSQDTKARARAAASRKTISINGLNADSQYYYKITALAESGIILSQFTGSFTTKSATGIDDVTAIEKVTVTARYDFAGRRIDAPVKGLNVIRYSDGSVRKVIVR